MFARAAPLTHWPEVSGSRVVATELHGGRTSLGRSDLPHGLAWAFTCQEALPTGPC